MHARALARVHGCTCTCIGTARLEGGQMYLFNEIILAIACDADAGLMTIPDEVGALMNHPHTHGRPSCLDAYAMTTHHAHAACTYTCTGRRVYHPRTHGRKHQGGAVPVLAALPGHAKAPRTGRSVGMPCSKEGRHVCRSGGVEEGLLGY